MKEISLPGDKRNLAFLRKPPCTLVEAELEGRREDT